MELAARLYAVKGWGTVYGKYGTAASIPEGSPSLTFHPNGDGYVPVPGDLVIEAATAGNASGHVAIVDHVTGSAVAAVEQNGSLTGWHPGGYSLSGSQLVGGYGPVRGVEHAPANHADNSGAAVGDGSYVRTPDGSIFRIAGGAPLYVSSCASLNGCPGWVSVPDLRAFRSRPTDGVFIRGASSGDVYVTAGGAPLYINSWTPFGGPQPTIDLDDWAIAHLDHLNGSPADGTFIRAQDTGSVYRVAGGAALYLNSVAPFGGAQATVGVTQYTVDSGARGHLAQAPADGTFIRGADTGRVYRIAGGAPLYINSFDAIAGTQPFVDVTEWTIDNGGGGRLGAYPADRTFIRGFDSQRVYQLLGGVPQYVASWDTVGGPQPFVDVTQWTIDHRAPDGSGATHLQSAPTNPGVPAQRLAGADRVATATAASLNAFANNGSAGAAIIATVDTFADALAAAPLALAKNAPVLLTGPATLDPRSANELTRVLAAGSSVYLIGGTSALSATIAAEVSYLGYQPVRLAGQDRYGTALTIADALGNPNTVFETSGTNFADAVSAGSAAARHGAAILLTDGSRQSAPTASYFSAHSNITRFAIGGPAVIADPAATPIAGQDRYATSAMVASRFFPAPSGAGIATGQDFPDALSGGGFSALGNIPELLVPATGALPNSTAAYLQSAKNSILTVTVFGGTVAVADQVVGEVQQAA